MTELDVRRFPVLPETPDLSDSRRRLYEVAIELFGDRGYHGVSVKDLTDALGIKPPSLYSHVASKQDLLFELTRIGVQTHRNELRDALLSSQPDPREQVRSLVRAHVLVHLRYPDLARIINQEARHLDPEQSAAISQVQAETELKLLEVVDRGLRLGTFRVDHMPRTMRMIADLGIRTAEWAVRPAVLEHEAIADYYAKIALLTLTEPG